MHPPTAEEVGLLPDSADVERAGTEKDNEEMLLSQEETKVECMGFKESGEGFVGESEEGQAVKEEGLEEYVEENVPLQYVQEEEISMGCEVFDGKCMVKGKGEFYVCRMLLI